MNDYQERMRELREHQNTLLQKLPPDKAYELVEAEIQKIETTEIYYPNKSKPLPQGYFVEEQDFDGSENEVARIIQNARNFSHQHQPSTRQAYPLTVNIDAQTMPPTIKPRMVQVPPQYAPTSSRVVQVPTQYIPSSFQKSEDAAINRGWAIALGVVLGCAVLSAAAFFKPELFSPTRDIPTLTTPDAKPPPKLEPTPKLGQKIGRFRITSAYGKRRLNGNIEFHGGVDVGLDIGTPYFMPGADGTRGRVRCFWSLNGGGNVAEVFSNDPRYKGHKMQILHTKDRSCIPGQHTAGSRIAEGGSTGRSTGPHLHFQVFVNRRLVSPSLTPVREVLYGNRSKK